MAIAAIGQICSTASMAHNLEQCARLVGKAAAGGAKVLFLPEASDYIASSAEESLSLARSEAASPFVRGLQAEAARHRIAVSVGVHVPVAVKPAGGGDGPANPVVPTLPVGEAGSEEANNSAGAGAGASGKNNTTDETTTTKLYNRTIWINEDGSLDASRAYDKLHLFDYAGLRESAHTQAGTRLTPPFPTPVGRVGSLICFDLRFAEPALALAQPGARSPFFHTPAQLLTYPSAFTVPTGRAHWEVLLRARAVEAQAYVIAAAQVGWHNARRASYGSAMAVDPWGRVLCRLPGAKEEKGDGGDPEFGEGAVGALGLVDIDLGEWERVRERMPLVRRTDVYHEI